MHLLHLSKQKASVAILFIIKVAVNWLLNYNLIYYYYNQLLSFQLLWRVIENAMYRNDFCSGVKSNPIEHSLA